MTRSVLVCVSCFLFMSLCPSNTQGQCGTRPGYMKKRVIGGSEVPQATKWPWSGALLVDNTHYCGLTLISDQHVLTAAQCVVFVNEPSRYKAQFNKGTTHEQTFDVTAFFLHPSYNANTREHDGIILKLTSPVTITDELRPACIPEEGTDYSVYTDCHLTGFGVFDLNANTLPPKMHEIEFHLLTLADCNNIYELVVNDVILGNSQTCAGYLGLPANKGPCLGDGGSPLSCDQGDGTWAAVGLVSFGAGCGVQGIPIVFAKTSDMYDGFIMNAVSGIDPDSRDFDCKLDDEFPCQSGYCIPHTYRCDQWDDCPGGHDEQYCGPHVKFFDPKYDTSFDDTPGDVITTATVDDCAEMCLFSLDYLCNQFDYDATTSTCRLRMEDYQPVSLTQTADTVFFTIDRFPDCGATVETNYFDLPRFSAPRYFIDESTVRSCEITVQTLPGTKVKITFDHVLVHPDSPCTCKANIILNESNYCIDELPGTYTAIGNQVVVRWESQRPELSGFIATFEGL
ncbi:serine protease 33-like [Glandiceps talaboti]